MSAADLHLSSSSCGPGFRASLLTPALIDGNPLEDVSLFQLPHEMLDLILKAGRVVVDRTGD